MKQTENALLAKVHVMYSRRLSDDDYRALSGLKGNDEILAYLKANSQYGPHLKLSPGTKVTPERLESAVKHAELEIFSSLCRMEMFLGESLYRYFIECDEVEMILYCARYLDTDTIDDLFVRPDFYAKNQSVNGYTLQRARSFDELYRTLDNTPYKKRVGPLISHGIENIGLAPLESVLFNFIYENAVKRIEDKIKGKSKDELLSYLKLLSDAKTIESIYRSVANYPQSNIYKSRLLVTSVTAFSDKEIQTLYDANTADEVVDVLKNSVYRKHFEGIDDFEHIDKILNQILVSVSKQNIRYSQNPLLCVFSYHTYSEYEVQNLIHIIEGIKYGLSPDEIDEILVKGGI